MERKFNFIARFFKNVNMIKEINSGELNEQF